MVRTEPIIAVRDVPKSSKFYQDLLGCKSTHGGEDFEILTDEETVVLCLHKWGEHQHPTMLSPDKTAGNGLILFFRVGNLNEIFNNARNLAITPEKEIHYNDNSGRNQFILRDPDGYYLIISE
ncbi:MAG: VOC family protein [Sphingobacteriaceae bacterium]